MKDDDWAFMTGAERDQARMGLALAGCYFGKEEGALEAASAILAVIVAGDVEFDHG